MSKKKRTEHHGFCDKKPDGDNCEKMIYDCLQKAGVIENDSRIVCARWEKRYGDEPATQIRIYDVISLIAGLTESGAV